MDEIWQPIIDFRRYEVSNKGRVRNARTKRVLAANPTKSHKHPQVFLVKGFSDYFYQGKWHTIPQKYQITLSHLVYDAFNRTRNERTCLYGSGRIGHKDGNILNNESTNLFRY